MKTSLINTLLLLTLFHWQSNPIQAKDDWTFFVSCTCSCKINGEVWVSSSWSNYLGQVNGSRCINSCIANIAADAGVPYESLSSEKTRCGGTWKPIF